MSEIMGQASVIEYPELWPKPKYHFGQVVLVRASGGISQKFIVGMRFGDFADRRWQTQEWRYQVIEMEGSNPSRYCDGRWHQEEALSVEDKNM